MLTGHQKIALIGGLPPGATARMETAGVVVECGGWAVVLTHADARGCHTLTGPLDISGPVPIPTSDLRGQDFHDTVRAALVGIVRMRP